MADQRRDQIPDRCVKRGVPTDRAVHAWAIELDHADRLWLAFGPLLRLVARLIRRGSERIVLPLSPPAWSSLRAGLRWVVVLAGLGTGSLVLGLLQGDVGVVVLGAVLLVVAWAVRILVLWRRWVGVVLRPGAEEVVVTRVDPVFGDAAQELFVRSVLPGQPSAPRGAAHGARASGGSKGSAK
jgi:hypothetical protein